MTVYRVPRLTVFGKLPDGKPTGLGKLLHKVRVVVGYLTEYCYFTSACLGLEPLRPRHGRIRRHPRAQSSRHAGRRGGRPQAARQEVGVRSPRPVSRAVSVALQDQRRRARHTWAPRCCEKLSVKCADVVIATNESYRAIDIERNGAAPERVFIVRNGPDREAGPVDGAGRAAAEHEQEDSGLRRRDEPAGRCRLPARSRSRTSCAI